MFGGINIMSLQNFYRVINFELDELLIALVFVAVLVLVVRKIMLALKTEGKIDERLRGSRARISKAVTEIEEYKDKTSKVEVEVEVAVEQELNTGYVRETLIQAKTEDTNQLMENVKQKVLAEEVSWIPEVSKVVLKGKKTRAMSMEERWAEYDKKRSMRSSGTA